MSCLKSVSQYSATKSRINLSRKDIFAFNGFVRALSKWKSDLLEVLSNLTGPNVRTAYSLSFIANFYFPETYTLWRVIPMLKWPKVFWHSGANFPKISTLNSWMVILWAMRSAEFFSLSPRDFRRGPSLLHLWLQALPLCLPTLPIHSQSSSFHPLFVPTLLHIGYSSSYFISIKTVLTSFFIILYSRQ